MTMSTINNKINWSLLAALFGAAGGALSGEFVWALITAFGLWVVACVAQNLSGFQRAISHRKRSAFSEDGVMIDQQSGYQNWLHRWDDEVTYCQSYEDAPGNIWNKAVSARDD